MLALPGGVSELFAQLGSLAAQFAHTASSGRRSVRALNWTLRVRKHAHRTLAHRGGSENLDSGMSGLPA